MFKAGIVERAKVTPSALQNAASIAAMVLTTAGTGAGMGGGDFDY
ncbi:MAG: hypothetical protein RLZZ338_4265 [Cyanobacteriota bacterium]|jgi:chaperonin GroEL (HSP60 family)